MQPCDDSQDCILRRGIDEAVKLILSENNTLFQSIISVHYRKAYKLSGTAGIAPEHPDGRDKADLQS